MEPENTQTEQNAETGNTEQNAQPQMSAEQQRQQEMQYVQNQLIAVKARVFDAEEQAKQANGTLQNIAQLFEARDVETLFARLREAKSALDEKNADTAA